MIVKEGCVESVSGGNALKVFEVIYDCVADHDGVGTKVTITEVMDISECVTGAVHILRVDSRYGGEEINDVPSRPNDFIEKHLASGEFKDGHPSRRVSRPRAIVSHNLSEQYRKGKREEHPMIDPRSAVFRLSLHRNDLLLLCRDSQSCDSGCSDFRMDVARSPGRTRRACRSV